MQEFVVDPGFFPVGAGFHDLSKFLVERETKIFPIESTLEGTRDVKALERDNGSWVRTVPPDFLSLFFRHGEKALRVRSNEDLRIKGECLHRLYVLSAVIQKTFESFSL